MARHWRQVSLEEAKQHPLYGVKNWLAVFAFGVLLIPLRELGGLSGAAHDAGLTVTQFLAQNEAFGTFVKAVLALQTLMLAVIYWLLFKKQPGFRVAASAILVGYWPVVSLFALATQAPGVGGVIGLGLISWMLSCAVWVTYLQRSRRVRVTFENCVPVENAHPELLKAQPIPTTTQGETTAAQISASVETTNVMSAGVSVHPVEVNPVAKFGPWIFGAVCLVALLLNVTLKKDPTAVKPAAAIASASRPDSQFLGGADTEKSDAANKSAIDISQQNAGRSWQVAVNALVETAKAEGLDYANDAELRSEFDGLVKTYATEATARGMPDADLTASKWALLQAHDVMKQRHTDKLVNTTADMKSSVRTAISAAVRNQAPPVPEFRDTNTRLSYLRWLDRMNAKLGNKIPDKTLRTEFLQTVWYESRRAGLDSALVLEVISTLSGFQELYASKSGAKGYMAVNPRWVATIGDGDESKLFHLQTNLRFGCVILSHYVDVNQGDINKGVLAYLSNSFGAERDNGRDIRLLKRIEVGYSKWQ